MPCPACDYADNGWCPCKCHVDDLIEASSLGTAQAKAIRDSVDDESVQRILDRVNRRRSRIPKQGRS